MGRGGEKVLHSLLSCAMLLSYLFHLLLYFSLRKACFPFFVLPSSRLHQRVDFPPEEEGVELARNVPIPTFVLFCISKRVTFRPNSLINCYFTLCSPFFSSFSTQLLITSFQLFVNCNNFCTFISLLCPLSW